MTLHYITLHFIALHYITGWSDIYGLTRDDKEDGAGFRESASDTTAVLKPRPTSGRCRVDMTGQPVERSR